MASLICIDRGRTRGGMGAEQGQTVEWRGWVLAMDRAVKTDGGAQVIRDVTGMRRVLVDATRNSVIYLNCCLSAPKDVLDRFKFQPRALK